jgi:orotidine-5'-phosphate decarboxylase
VNAFFEKLERAVMANRSRLCIGLDPRMEKLPSLFRYAASPLFAFNKAIIIATAPYACAYKPNLAFYIAQGLEGVTALKKTIRYIPPEIPIIADAKWGDIGSTAEVYASAIFEEFKCDAVTLNPLLGEDSVAPFLKYSRRGLYILCLTSNSGSANFQLPHDLYLRIAEKVSRWNRAGNCGLVVGATLPDYVKKIRTRVPDIPFLIPGIGAQGGELKKTIPAARDSKGGGFIISVSRGITECGEGENFADNVRKAAREFRDAINKVGGLFKSHIRRRAGTRK